MWPGRTDGVGLGVPAAAVLPLLVGAGLAHLNGHNQASSEGSREGCFPSASLQDRGDGSPETVLRPFQAWSGRQLMAQWLPVAL